MSKDIYGMDVEIGDAWQIGGAVIQLGDKGGGLLVTQCSIAYGRGVNTIRPLNQTKRFMMVGEGEGGISISTIIGPSKGIREFLQQFSDPCNISKNILTVNPVGIVQCSGTNEAITFRCEGCLLSSIKITATKAEGGISMVTGEFAISMLGLTTDNQGTTV